MQKIKKAILKSVGSMLVMGLLAASMVLSLSTRAQALEISVATPTIVPTNLTIDAWSWTKDAQTNATHVVYSTVSATEYTIMFASSNPSGVYTTTVLSTGVIAHKPKFLNLVMGTNDLARTYFYDASTGAIRYINGTTLVSQNSVSILSSTVTAAGVSTGAIRVPNMGNLKVSRKGDFVDLILYSSRTVSGSYNLLYNQVAVDTNIAVYASTEIVLGSQSDISGGLFYPILTNRNGRYGVVYYDAASQNLKFGVIQEHALSNDLKWSFLTQETIDTLAITSLSVDDSLATSGLKEVRVAYGSSSVFKHAVNRQKVAAGVWYVSSIPEAAGGFSAGILSESIGSFFRNIGYIKDNTLYWARGRAGIFFDDYSENLVRNFDNNEPPCGIAAVQSDINSGAFVNSGVSYTDGSLPRLLILPSEGGVTAAKSVSIEGSLNISRRYLVHGFPGTPIPSVSIYVTVGSSETSSAVKNKSSYLATKSDSSGNYYLFVAPNSTITVIPSFGSLTFRESVGLKLSSSVFVNSNLTQINFLGVSAPSLLKFAHQQDPFVFESSVSVTFGSVGLEQNIPAEASFRLFSSTGYFSGVFPAGGSLRLVPQSAKGVTPSFSQSTGTAVEFSTDSHISLNFEAIGPYILDVGGDTRNLFASTAIPNGKWYTVVFTTVVEGVVKQSSLVDGFLFTPMQISTASFAFGSSINYGNINSSTDTRLNLVVPSNNGYTFPYGADFSVPSFEAFLSTTGSDSSLQKLSFSMGGTTVPLTALTMLQSTSAIVTGNIFGLDVNTYPNWYVHVATQIGGVWHRAVSGPISINSPSISRVRIRNSVGTGSIDDLILANISTSAANSNLGNIVLDINGVGFHNRSAVFLSTGFNNIREIIGTADSTTTAKLSSSFSINSSTWASLTLNLKTNNISTAEQYRIVVGTVSSGLRSVNGSTVTGVFAYTSAPVVRLSSPAVTEVRLTVQPEVDLRNSSSPQIANVQRYTFDIYGWGLLNSTVSLIAVDGSTSTPSTIAASSANGTKLTATIDLSRVHSNKWYTVQIGSAPVGQTSYSTGVVAQGRATSAGVFSDQVVYIGSMAISTITTPVLADIPNGTIYNTTRNVTLALQGVGFVSGSTVNIKLGDVSFTTAFTTASNAARTLHFVVPGTATISTSTLSSGLFGAPAGEYVVTLTTIAKNHEAKVAVGSLNIKAPSISDVIVNGENYATISRASFTVVGSGLINIASATLTAPSESYQPAIVANLTQVNSSTAILGFDLTKSSVTTTTASWQANITFTALNTTLNLTKTGIVINTAPVVESLLSASASNELDSDVVIYGKGLTNGASVFFTFTGDTNTSYGFIGEVPLTSTQVVASLFVDDAFSTQVGTAVFPAGKANGVWSISVSTTYNNDGVNQTRVSNAKALFTVLESSAPAVPTGLRTLSTNGRQVTLQWTAPSDDFNTGNLLTGSKFIVYFSSSSANVGNNECASCFPVRALESIPGSDPLEDYSQSESNYHFANTWAAYLPTGFADKNNAGDDQFLILPNPVQGLVVGTVTVALADLTVKDSSSSTSGVTGSTSVAPGKILEATITLPGKSGHQFWFVVRAEDESGNRSTVNALYSTATAVLAAISDVSTVSSGDRAINPNSDNTVTYSVNQKVNGVTLTNFTIDTPAGSVDSADAFKAELVVKTSNATQDSAGVEGIAASVQIETDNGTTEFKKAITITWRLVASEVDSKLAGKSSNLVKLAFHNGNRWVPIADSNYSNGVLTARVAHLTEFRAVILTPLENLASAIVYPNPYRPAVDSHSATGITFDLLPADATLKVYTLAGDLVREIRDEDGDGQIVWDAKNSNGSAVASGVYFALLKGRGDTRTIKIAVQR